MKIDNLVREIIKMRDEEGIGFKEIGIRLGIEPISASNKYVANKRYIGYEKDLEDEIARLNISTKTYNYLRKHRNRDSYDRVLYKVEDLVKLIDTDTLINIKGISRSSEEEIIEALIETGHIEDYTRYSIHIIWNTTLYSKRIINLYLIDDYTTYEIMAVYDINTLEMELYFKTNDCTYNKETIKRKVKEAMREDSIIL